MSAVSFVCIGEPAAVLVEELAKLGLGIGVLREDAFARDFGDVGRLEVDLQGLREAVHQARELDPRVVEPADELVELLLRGHDEPILPRPTRPRLCTTAWRSSIFCTSRATNWPTSSTTKTSDSPGLPPVHQLLAALGEVARRDVRPVLDRLRPAVGESGTSAGRARASRGSPAACANAIMPFSASQSFS